MTDRSSQTSCPFCLIATGKTTTQLIYQDDLVVAFHDRSPITPIHILITPKQHITSLEAINIEDQTLPGHMVMIARDLARQFNVQSSGYRLVINTGPDAGQSVFHIHLHLIAGRRMPFRFE